MLKNIAVAERRDISDGLATYQLLLSELSKHPVGELHTVGAVSRNVKLNISGSMVTNNTCNKWTTECDGVLHIIEALQTNTSLTELYLIDSIPVIPECSEQSSSVFSKMLQVNGPLKHLVISTSNWYVAKPSEISRRSATAIFFFSIVEGLQCNSTLIYMSLVFYNITAIDPDTAKSLTKMLQVNKTLTHLDLSQNSLSDLGARCIFEGLQHNTTLVMLSLQNNNITATDPDTAKSLTKMLQVNKSLSYLDLSCNQYGHRMTPGVFQALKHNTALLHLNLRDTGITDADAECIGQALKSNNVLQSLNIDTNLSLGDEGGHYILESLLFNTAFKELRVSILDWGAKRAFYIARNDTGLPFINVFSSS